MMRCYWREKENRQAQTQICSQIDVHVQTGPTMPHPAWSGHTQPYPNGSCRPPLPSLARAQPRKPSPNSNRNGALLAVWLPQYTTHVDHVFFWSDAVCGLSHRPCNTRAIRRFRLKSSGDLQYTSFAWRNPSPGIILRRIIPRQGQADWVRQAGVHKACTSHASGCIAM